MAAERRGYGNHRDHEVSILCENKSLTVCVNRRLFPAIIIIATITLIFIIGPHPVHEPCHTKRR